MGTKLDLGVLDVPERSESDLKIDGLVKSILDFGYLSPELEAELRTLASDKGRELSGFYSPSMSSDGNEGFAYTDGYEQPYTAVPVMELLRFRTNDNIREYPGYLKPAAFAYLAAVPDDKEVVLIWR